MTTDLYIPKTGDDLFTCSERWLSRAIAFATRHRGEAPTLATHQGKFLDSCYTVEAGFGGVRKHLWGERQYKFSEGRIEWCIVGPTKPLGPDLLFKMREEIERTVGLPYAFLELGLQLLDGGWGRLTGTPTHFFSRLGTIEKDNAICSKAGNIPDVNLGLLPREFRFAPPDTTWDYKMKSHRWEIKATSPGWPTEDD